MGVLPLKCFASRTCKAHSGWICLQFAPCSCMWCVCAATAPLRCFRIYSSPCSERGYVQHLGTHGVSLREQPVVPLLNHVLGADRKVCETA